MAKPIKTALPISRTVSTCGVDTLTGELLPAVEADVLSHHWPQDHLIGLAARMTKLKRGRPTVQPRAGNRSAQSGDCIEQHCEFARHFAVMVVMDSARNTGIGDAPVSSKIAVGLNEKLTNLRQ